MKSIIALLQSYWLRFVYRNRPYSEYYAKLMNTRAEADPKKAVGGRWEEIGPLQLDFLVRHGLTSATSLLDFGCGSLRGGIHFIQFLDAGKYTGVDISENLISYAKNLIAEGKLDNKAAKLILSHDLTLSYFDGTKFDFIIATSVLTHMLMDDIKVFLENLSRIMTSQSVFYATYLERSEDRNTTNDFQNFYYTYEEFQNVAESVNLKVEQSKDFDHPRGQKMLAFRLK